jgi:ABC-type branched-subunit amino acid transport system substrate-binding protein
MNKRLAIILVSITSLITLVGGAYWFFSHRGATATHELAESPASEPSLQSPEETEKEQLSPQPPITVAGSVWEKPLLSGEEKQLVLATILAKSGEASLIGKALSDGFTLAVNVLNSTEGGLFGGHRLALDQRDDASLLSRGMKHLRELVEKTPFFFGVMGEELVEKGMSQLVGGDSIGLLFPTVGMQQVAAARNRAVYFRPSYADEVHALIHYALHTLKKKKIALFYEESGWGEQAKNAAQEVLVHHGEKLLGSSSYQQGTVNVLDAVNELKKLEPEVIICAANGRPAYNFIREAVNQKLHYVTFLGTSRLAGIQEHLEKARGIKLVTSAVVPNPHRSGLEIAEKYREAMQKYLPNKGLSPFSFEGYIAAHLLIHFIEQLTPAAQYGHLISAIRKAGAFTFEGLQLNGGASSLSRTVWLNEGDEKEWHPYIVNAGPSRG